MVHKAQTFLSFVENKYVEGIISKGRHYNSEIRYIFIYFLLLVKSINLFQFLNEIDNTEMFDELETHSFIIHSYDAFQ